MDVVKKRKKLIKNGYFTLKNKYPPKLFINFDLISKILIEILKDKKEVSDFYEILTDFEIEYLFSLKNHLNDINIINVSILLI
jgi:hypothetical protein